MHRWVCVYSAPNLAQSETVRQILALEGIEADTRHAALGMAIGGIPIGEAGIEVWVPEDEAPSALRVIEGFTRGDPDLTADPCRCCGAPLPADLAVCWQCGMVRAELRGSTPVEVPPPPTRLVPRRSTMLPWAFLLLLALAFVGWLVSKRP